MSKFVVAYNETHQKTFLVLAESSEEALDVVELYPESVAILETADSVLAQEPRISWFVSPFAMEETFKASSLNLLQEVYEVLTENLLEQSDIALAIRDFLNQQEDLYSE